MSLFTCGKCLRMNFTERGYMAHRCSHQPKPDRLHMLEQSDPILTLEQFEKLPVKPTYLLAPHANPTA